MHRRRSPRVVLASFYVLTLSMSATAGIQSVPAADLIAALPSPPAGWSGPQTDTASGSVGDLDASQALATYSGPAGVTAELTYTSSSAMIAASKAMGTAFKSQSMVDMMNRNNPNKTYGRFESGSWLGWTIVNRADSQTELSAFNDKIVVTLKIDRADAEALAAFIGAIDWESLGALATES